METKSIVFQVDSKEVEQIYDNSKNYLIEYSSGKSNNENYCIIYFSSNDIYYPNNERAFINQIAVKNKFEWYNTRISKGVKHIFVRDIKKQWYLTGINKEINNIDKLFQFLSLRYFRDEFEAHIREKRCPAGKCKSLITYFIDADACTGCMLCAKKCPTNCITGERKQPHVIDVAQCIKCDTCRQVCKFNAVKVHSGIEQAVAGASAGAEN